VSELTPDEALAMIHAPRTIYAPEGSAFVAQFFYDAETLEQLHDFGRIRYEVRGPLGKSNHLWVADRNGEFLGAGDDDVPMEWTLKAEIALGGWLRLQEELTP